MSPRNQAAGKGNALLGKVRRSLALAPNAEGLWWGGDGVLLAPADKTWGRNIPAEKQTVGTWSGLCDKAFSKALVASHALYALQAARVARHRPPQRLRLCDIDTQRERKPQVFSNDLGSAGLG